MDHRLELVDVIRRVRNRWRMKLALRGAVVVVAGTVLDSHESTDGDETARQRAIASAEQLARGGDTVEVYRNAVAGEIGRAEPELVHTAPAG